MNYLVILYCILKKIGAVKTFGHTFKSLKNNLKPEISSVCFFLLFSYSVGKLHHFIGKYSMPTAEANKSYYLLVRHLAVLLCKGNSCFSQNQITTSVALFVVLLKGRQWEQYNTYAIVFGPVNFLCSVLTQGWKTYPRASQHKTMNFILILNTRMQICIQC